MSEYKLKILVLDETKDKSTQVNRIDELLKSWSFETFYVKYTDKSEKKLRKKLKNAVNKSTVTVILISDDTNRVSMQLKALHGIAYIYIPINTQSVKLWKVTCIDLFEDWDAGKGLLYENIANSVVKNYIDAMVKGDYRLSLKIANSYSTVLANQELIVATLHFVKAIPDIIEKIKTANISEASDLIRSNEKALAEFSLTPNYFLLMLSEPEIRRLISKERYTEAQKIVIGLQPYLEKDFFRDPNIFFIGGGQPLIVTLSNKIIELSEKIREIVFNDTYDTYDVAKAEVIFSAYNPRKIQKKKRYSVIIYAYREKEERELIQADIRKFETELGEQPKERKAQSVTSIQRKTAIEVVPECDGIDFEPRSLTKTWDGEWIRYNFDLKVPDTFQEDELWLRISIRIKGLEVAHIKSSCEIIEEEISVKEPPKVPENPLAQAMELGDLYQAIAKPYRNVFISYSRKDQEFALQRATEIEQILGDKVFLDVKSMRAGQHWQQELAKAIRDADIFHLLWSEHSAESEYCRYEWDYALNHKCPDNMCVGVIRPVYWSKPMPDPPEELSHLHFEYIEPTEETVE